VARPGWGTGRATSADLDRGQAGTSWSASASSASLGWRARPFHPGAPGPGCVRAGDSAACAAAELDPQL